MMRKTIFTLGVAACLAISASAQQGQKPEQPPVFRSSTRLVVNTVTVRDRTGKVIEGLTAKDFVVTEDNERQDIAFVEFQRLVGEPPPPGVVAAAEPPAAAPAAQAAAAPAAPAAAAPAPEVSSVVANPIATPASGDIKYRNRRLLIFYFDQSA